MLNTRSRFVGLIAVFICAVAIFLVIVVPILRDLASSATIVDTIARLVYRLLLHRRDIRDQQDDKTNNTKQFHNYELLFKLVISKILYKYGRTPNTKNIIFQKNKKRLINKPLCKLFIFFLGHIPIGIEFI